MNSRDINFTYVTMLFAPFSLSLLCVLSTFYVSHFESFMFYSFILFPLFVVVLLFSLN